MIYHVEHFGSELKLQLLAEGRCFEQRQVQIRVTRTDQRIAAEAPEVLRSGQAGSCAAVARRVQSAGYFEGRQVQEIVRCVSARIRVSHDVRAREEFACAVVVVKQIDVKRAPRAQCEDPIKLPAVAELRIALPKSWNVISERPHQPV